eukprot:CAMPEP_0173200618 /NCGR_PEP_ID=MMETSP1141-20130122/17886_1 /TAXON_ID=483371 /ORGANISM="non described non described, Strain CCMP2298" /LENGTH=78 /DNA_ID=CAMNT_0014125629 /DNA_START=770 /DNA_END=1007 /DNA_ORIENTATION=-
MTLLAFAFRAPVQQLHPRLAERGALGGLHAPSVLRAPAADAAVGGVVQAASVRDILGNSIPLFVNGFASVQEGGAGLH